MEPNSNKLPKLPGSAVAIGGGEATGAHAGEFAEWVRAAEQCGEVGELAGRVAAAQRAEVHAELATGRTPLTVLSLGANAAGRASAVGDLSAERARRACRAGCSACCHMAVSITAVEALLMAARLRERAAESSSAEQNAAVERERIDANAQRVAHLTIEQRAAARVPCALLGPDGACTIYEFRPIGCRGWTSLSRAVCDQALAAGEPGHSGPQDRVALAAASAVTEGLEQALRGLRLDAGSYELHAAVSRALDTPDAVERWLGGEDVFAGCPRVTSERLRGR